LRSDAVSDSKANRRAVTSPVHWQTAVYGRTADFIYRACRGLATSSSR
jgi:hypothetical protein